MSFLPDVSEWIRLRIEYIPRETATFCGDLSGLSILDVGCGDMLADVGLLSLGPKCITGVDVLTPEWDVKEYAASNVAKAGFSVPSDYASRLEYVSYNGLALPFEDNAFDLVFSWGVFEHVGDVPSLLREARRVVKPAGRIFIVVYPWFHSYAGSHLSDFIDQPYFHLTQSKEWIEHTLKDKTAGNPEKTEQVRQIWPEFCTLNGYSARMFLTTAMEAGLMIERLQCHTNEDHADSAPPHVDRADVIATGTTVLFHPAKRASLRP